MRIGFTGAQGTGKSTLVDILVNDVLVGYHRHTNASRILSSELDNFGINRNAGFLEQCVISGSVALDVISNRNLVADRTIIDTLAYASNNENINSYQVHELMYKFLAVAELYDHIFYVPIEFTTEEDGIRDTDDNYRRVIDRSIKSLLDISGVYYTELNGTVEERLATIKDEIYVY